MNRRRIPIGAKVLGIAAVAILSLVSFLTVGGSSVTSVIWGQGDKHYQTASLLATSSYSTPAKSVFSGAGLFVWNPWERDPEGLAADLIAARFDWIAILTHDGEATQGSYIFYDAAWIRRFKAAAPSIRVGCWGPLREKPVREALVAALTTLRRGCAFYIANAEIEYKRTGPNYEQRPEAWERSETFTRVFRAALPSIPAMLSTYPMLTLADIDYGPWIRRGFHVGPQAYSEHGFTPRQTVDAALAVGFARDRIHPTVDAYRGYPPASHASALGMDGATGFSIYVMVGSLTRSYYTSFAGVG